MRDARSLLGPVVLVVLLAISFAVRAGGSPQPVPAAGGAPGAFYASAKDLPAPSALRFAPGIAESDQRIVRQVIAEARPEARRLVELVAGLVTIRFGRPDARTAGSAGPSGDGFGVELDLGGVYRTMGMRGLRRLVMHEMAHVIDQAVVPLELELELDAATPRGFGCDGANSGGCAARAERFAESFAKWATGDIGNDLYLGYRVPPPTSLSGWGAPLAEIRR